MLTGVQAERRQRKRPDADWIRDRRENKIDRLKSRREQKRSW